MTLHSIRGYAAKSGKTARTGIFVSLGFWFLFDSMTTITGLYAAASLRNIPDPAMSYPLLAENILPSFAKGFFFIGMIATIMSTLHSNIFISATTLGRDIYSKYRNIDESKNEFSKAGIIISSLLSLLIAILVPSVVQIWYLIGSLTIPALLISVVSSYFRRLVIDKNYIFWGMIVSFLFSLICAMEGERKLVTVLFADVADFTTLSETLDHDELHAIMDGCFKILMDEIHRYEGTINQFTGDGVMALFGAPVAHEDHARMACHAALAIQRAIMGYGDQVKKDYGINFKMRVGLNSGPVIVGSIGDDLRMDYTAVGDTTNLAARMESLAKPGTVLLSKATHRLVKDYFEFQSLGQIEVKGKEELQEAHELIRAGEVATRFGASVAKGLTRFVGRRNSMAALMESWEKTQSGSGQVVGIVGEAGVGNSRFLLEFRNNLPRGVTRPLCFPPHCKRGV